MIARRVEPKTGQPTSTALEGNHEAASHDNLDKDATYDASEDGFDPISEELCIQILREGGVGLLAVNGPDAPELRPVNFAISRHRVVMRTGYGRIFEGAQHGEAASFVMTEVDPTHRSGRSIVVVGRLSICDPSDSAMRAAVRPWTKAPRPERILLSIDQISGRRISARPETA